MSEEELKKDFNEAVAIWVRNTETYFCQMCKDLYGGDSEYFYEKCKLCRVYCFANNLINTLRK